MLSLYPSIFYSYLAVPLLGWGIAIGILLFLYHPFNPVAIILTLKDLATPTIITTRSLNRYFKLYWICTVVAIPPIILGVMGIMLGAVVIEIGEEPVGMEILAISSFILLLGCFVVILRTVFKMLLLYQLWKLIPTDIARTTPGQAVGFCFIPIFNYYWAFIAYRGLSEDMNKTLQKRGIQCKVNDQLGMGLCIVHCCELVPGIGFLPFLAGDVVAIFFLKSVKDDAIALLEQCEKN